jgi:hypothetical protein
MSTPAWKKANLESVKFLVPKHIAPQIKARAKSLNKSTVRYILECIQSEMDTHNWPEYILGDPEE